MIHLNKMCAVLFNPMRTAHLNSLVIVNLDHFFGIIQPSNDVSPFEYFTLSQSNHRMNAGVSVSTVDLKSANPAISCLEFLLRYPSRELNVQHIKYKIIMFCCIIRGHQVEGSSHKKKSTEMLVGNQHRCCSSSTECKNFWNRICVFFSYLIYFINYSY